MTEEHMKTYSIALYPSTHKEYMELKEELKLTHDELIRMFIEERKAHKSE